MKWHNKLKRMAHVVLTSIQDHFTLGKLLGKGYNSKVHKCVNKDSRNEYAVKSIEKFKLKDNERSLVIHLNIHLFNRSIF